MAQALLGEDLRFAGSRSPSGRTGLASRFKGNAAPLDHEEDQHAGDDAESDAIPQRVVVHVGIDQAAERERVEEPD